MALKIKVELDSIDKSGSIFNIADKTGAYSSQNLEGWGGSNQAISDFSTIFLTLEESTVSKKYSQTYVRTADPTHPEYLLYPTLEQISEGELIQITSQTLNITPSAEPFEDGVYSVNVNYILNTAKTGVFGGKGAWFLTGTGLDAFAAYDSILIGDNLYDINHTRSTEGGTILWLVQELQDNASSFIPVYKVNVKFLNSQDTKTCLLNKVGKLAICGCSREVTSKLQDVQILMYGANLGMEAGDLVGASKLIKTANRVCKSKGCNCK